MKKILVTLSLLSMFVTTSYSCFDTYLFLHKRSMVYPHRTLVFELNNEYSFNKIGSPENDLFFLNGNVYYGLTRDFSVQFSLGSAEKQRNNLKLDKYGLRGVYNLFISEFPNYALDIIAEHMGTLDGSENEMAFSLPNIFHTTQLTYVIHPTMTYAFKEDNVTIGGHTGIFYDFNQSGLIGIGAEYASVQSSSSAGQRITQSEFSASLFFGAYIGKSFYIQNEIAKGLANSRDFGFALTTKVIL